MLSIDQMYEKACQETLSDIYKHLPRLYELAASKLFPEILELGVRGGNSTMAFLKAIQDRGGKLTSVDIEDMGYPIHDYYPQKNWEFIKTDDNQYHELLQEKYDVIFIDTSHQYDHTYRELVLYAPHLREDGFIIMHDTVSCPDVLRAIRVWYNGFRDQGWKLRTFSDNNGLAVIWKDEKLSKFVGDIL